MMIEVALRNKGRERPRQQQSHLRTTRVGFVQRKFIPGMANRDPDVADQSAQPRFSVADHCTDFGTMSQKQWISMSRSTSMKMNATRP